MQSLIEWIIITHKNLSEKRREEFVTALRNCVAKFLGEEKTNVKKVSERGNVAVLFLVVIMVAIVATVIGGTFGNLIRDLLSGLPQ